MALFVAVAVWLRSGKAHSAQTLAGEVRQGPLPSNAGRRGPTTTTAIKSWQMRSGEEGRRKERSKDN